MDLLRTSVEEFQKMPAQEQDRLALQASGAYGRNRLVLGRLLLSLYHSRAFRKLGCSTMPFYAAQRLGLEVWELREYCDVARRLEHLPKLRAAAEDGLISWSRLKLVCRWAKPNDEGYWLRKAQKHPPRELRVLHRRKCRQDGQPTQSAERVRVSWHLEPVTLALFQRALRRLSERGQCVISLEAGLRLMAMEALTNTAFLTENVQEKLLAEAQKDVLAEDDAEWVPDDEDEDVEEDSPEEPSVAQSAPMRLVVDQLIEQHLAQAAPWSVMHSETVSCPTDPGIQIVQAPKLKDWQNPRLSFNPQSRCVTPAQSIELERRDGYACRTPNCPNRLWLHAHHIVFFYRGGATVPSNLVVLCPSCHRALHRGFIRIMGEAPGNLLFTDPHGTDLRLFRGYGAGEPFNEWMNRGDTS